MPAPNPTLQAEDLVLCSGTVMTTPFMDRLEPARMAGFKGLSINRGDIASTRAAGISIAEVTRRVADEGLAIAEFDAVTSWLQFHQPDGQGGSNPLRTADAEHICPIAGELGARSVSVVELFGRKVELERAAEGFAHVCDVAADHELLVTLEFLPWGGVPSLAHALEVVRNAGRPNGSVLVDAWHFFRSGATLDELSGVSSQFIGYVQVDDGPKQAEDDLRDETMHRRLVPGDGEFDLVGFLRTLGIIGYHAPLGIEVFSDELLSLPIADIALRCAEQTREICHAARS
jgi:sugar phosphate isomerase/epimerase